MSDQCPACKTEITWWNKSGEFQCKNCDSLLTVPRFTAAFSLGLCTWMLVIAPIFLFVFGGSIVGIVAEFIVGIPVAILIFNQIAKVELKERVT